MRILIAGGGTGGHLMPALALADEFVRQQPQADLVLVGAERGVEARILPTRPWRFHLLPSEPIYRRQWWKNLRWVTALPRLRRAVHRVLDEERPDVVVGTGGYASGPVLWQAARRGIPIVLEEQNAYPGIATRRLARRAAQIHLGFPEARRHLRPGRDTEVHVPGVPIQPAGTVDRAAARAALGIAPDARVLFVFGGSQGAKPLNDVVSTALDQGLLQGVTLLWGTGPNHGSMGPRVHRSTVTTRPFWDPISEAYAATDLVVSRSGAATVAELAAWGLPAVFVPLPTAAADHQTANAQALVDTGGAVLLPQHELTPVRLDREVRGLLDDPDRLRGMSAQARSRARTDAARYIVERVLRLVST